MTDLDPHPQEIIELREAAERAEAAPCSYCDGMRSFPVQRMQGGEMEETWETCPRCDGEGIETQTNPEAKS